MEIFLGLCFFIGEGGSKISKFFCACCGRA